MTRLFPSKQAFEEWTREMASKYDPDDYLRSPNPLIRWIERGRARTVLRLLDANEASIVLDVGCGTGDMLQRVQAKHKSGVDLSDRYLQRCRERIPDATIIQGNGEDLPLLFPTTFTHIYSSEVIEHTQNALRFLQAIHAVLDRNGRCVISIPNDNLFTPLKKTMNAFGLYKLLFPQIYKSLENEWHLHVFEPKTFQKLCETAGFTVTRVQRSPFFLCPLHYVFLLGKKIETTMT